MCVDQQKSGALFDNQALCSTTGINYTNTKFESPCLSGFIEIRLCIDLLDQLLCVM